MYKEPRIFKEEKNIGRLNIKFEGEQYSALPILDTKVSINGETLCWITWKDKDQFISKINNIIDEYQI